MSDLLGSVLWMLVWLLICLVLLLLSLLLFRCLPKLLPFLRGVYLARIPLLVVLAVWGFCVAALFLPGTKSLLGNAFDLMGNIVDTSPGPNIGPDALSYFAVEVVFVSLIACLLASTARFTWWLVRLYGRKRFFDEDSVEIDPNVKLWHLIVSLLLVAVPVVASAIYGSVESSTVRETPLSEALIAVVVGIAAAVVGALFSYVFLLVASLVQRRLTRSAYAELPQDAPGNLSGIAGTSPEFFLPRGVRRADDLIDRARRHDPRRPWGQRATVFVDWLLPKDAKAGYLKRKDGTTLLLPGHTAAVTLFALTFGLYLAIGMVMYALAYHAGTVTLSTVPTLCYLLLLATMLCWGFSGLAFFFDRYRIPVLLPTLGLLLLASWSGPDYEYPTMPMQAAAPEEVEAPAGEVEARADTMVVVAANGGGIQAAAWTARVLTGLEQDCQAMMVTCDQRFGRSVRLISSVSGGSVGTMYFVNEYEEDGTLPGPRKLEEIVARAEGSSLDHIAWGLLYPDLARTVNVLPWTFGAFGLDRGQTLDKAWLREDTDWQKREGIEQGLSQWQDDAAAGRRPGVIFNTTIVETGQRLPLSTVPLPEDLPGGVRYGRLLEDIEPKPTIPVVTAARLSAAFPYVSPAARADVLPEAEVEVTPGAKPGEAGYQYHEDHLVDGGYYDNYGTSSLVEWLDRELAQQRESRPDRVVVVQIVASPSDNDLGRKSKKGWFLGRLDRTLYQALAPAKTVLNVRGAGQSTHSEVELRLLREKWELGNPRVDIVPVRFRFDRKDPPLSWHLTKKDKLEIEAEWQQESADRDLVIKCLTEPGKSCE